MPGSSSGPPCESRSHNGHPLCHERLFTDPSRPRGRQAGGRPADRRHEPGALIDGSLAKRGKPIGFESKGQLAWVGDQYKIYSSGKAKNGQPKFKLFDLVADPSEKNDLAQNHAALAKRLTGELAGGAPPAKRAPTERITDSARRRSKGRWLRWLLLFGGARCRGILLVVEQPGGASLQFNHPSCSGRVRRGVCTDQGRHLAGESFFGKTPWEGRRDRVMQLMELAAFEWADNHGVHDFEHSHVYDPRTKSSLDLLPQDRLDRYPHAEIRCRTPWPTTTQGAPECSLGQGGSPHQQHRLPPKHRLPLDAPIH
ncbi:MAG: hypothetical protein Ct9H300mP7_5700 [Verrucomicrobiota bacterium]|nr:MAG: hypothetical protein Ct9H300mP7_5700 [Verrucomicrobiota bacterium]